MTFLQSAALACRAPMRAPVRLSSQRPSVALVVRFRRGRKVLARAGEPGGEGGEEEEEEAPSALLPISSLAAAASFERLWASNLNSEEARADALRQATLKAEIAWSIQGAPQSAMRRLPLLLSFPSPQRLRRRAAPRRRRRQNAQTRGKTCSS